MSKNIFVIRLLLGAVLFAPIAAQAAQPSSSANPFSALIGAPVSPGTLAATHGKDVPTTNLASSSNNIANGTTGTINDTNSIAGNTGLTTVIQNTGNNSLFQTSTIVNITLNH